MCRTDFACSVAHCVYPALRWAVPPSTWSFPATSCEPTMTSARTAILFVDDQPERYAWFCEQLDELGRREPVFGISSTDVVYAECGPEALERLDDETIQILVAVVDLDF